jgi:hypothetical protein
MNKPPTVRQRFVLAALLGLLAGGCGKDQGSEGRSAGKPGRVASCEAVRAAGSCREYHEGNLVLGDESLKQLCDVVHGTFLPQPCPAANRIGSCAKPEGTDVYYGGEGQTMSLENLERLCREDARGTWKASP